MTGRMDRWIRRTTTGCRVPVSPGEPGVAVSALPFMWLDLLGRPASRDDAAVDWDVRVDRCVGQGQPPRSASSSGPVE